MRNLALLIEGETANILWISAVWILQRVGFILVHAMIMDLWLQLRVCPIWRGLSQVKIEKHSYSPLNQYGLPRRK